MTPETRERLFEPFFSTKTIGATRGTGLGLTMVHSLVVEEGLGLAFETELGRGSAFRIMIPVPDQTVAATNEARR